MSDEAMSFLGNIVWIVFGGLISFLLYMFGGVVLCLTIVGIPFGIACFRIGLATLAPFGGRVVARPDADDPLRLLFNVLWIMTFGLGLAINHLIWAGLLCLTIIGIPFGLQHLKLIPLSLLPFGRRFVKAS